jgi:NHL repeat
MRRRVSIVTNGNLYVADCSNDTIRKVTPVGTNWVVTTLAGVGGTDASGNPSYPGSTDGTGAIAQFNRPVGIAMDSAGNLYVKDGNNNTIRKGFPASSVPPPVLQPPSLSASRFGFGITGLPGLAVNIESSTNLSQWGVVRAGLVLTGGTNYYSVSPNLPSGAQFYRAQVR